jgi:protein phosphatase
LTDRIAIISDVHGNLTALETVLAHIKEAGITRIFNLGDLVGKGPRSAETLDRCREVCEVTVRGNWDAEIETAVGWPTADWHRQRLSREQLDYVATLPGSFDFLLSGHRVRLFHASQISPFDRVHADAPADVLDAMFDNRSSRASVPCPTSSAMATSTRLGRWPSSEGRCSTPAASAIHSTCRSQVTRCWKDSTATTDPLHGR